MTIEHEDLRQRSSGCLPTTFFGFVGADVHSLCDEYDAVCAERDRLTAEVRSLMKWRDELPTELNPSETPNGSPDDAKPITKEWWWTIGGEHRNGGNWLQPNGQSPLMPLIVVLRLSVDEKDVSLWIDDRIKWHELNLPAVRTRGDVRQLLKLLRRE